MLLSAILFWTQGVHGEVIPSISGEVTWKDEPNKIIDSDIIILSGGKLTIDNSIVKMNCMSEGDYKIEVRDGGELIIINNSKITAYYSDYEYNFYFLPGSKGTLSDTTIEECGYSGGGSKGINIQSDDVTIEDCTIQNSYNGIYAIHSSPMIANCTIKDNSQSGIYWDSGIMLWQDLFNDTSKISSSADVVVENGDVILDRDEYSTDANTVGLYHLNTGSGSTATDSSGNNNDGTIGGASWTTDAKFGSYALSFDGDDDYIDFGDVFDESTGSIEMWFKLDENFNSSSNSDMMLFSKYVKVQGKEYSVRLKFEADDGKIYFVITKQDAPYSIYSDSVSWVGSTWYHVASTWGSNGMKMYINNTVQQDTDGYTGYWDDKNSNAYVGASKDGNPYEDEFDGIIDEFRVSDIQRTGFLDEYVELGSVTSIPINAHQFDKWNILDISKTEPDQNHIIKVTIFDTTGAEINNFVNLTDSQIDISSIHASEYPTIILEADLYGDGSSYPSLHSWYIEGTTTIYNNTIEENSYGINLKDSSPTILNNTLTNNSNCGIKVVGSAPIIKNNEINSNGNGDGIYFEDSYPILFYNTIDNCEIGIKAVDSPTLPEASTIRNNTLYGVNEARDLYFISGSPPVHLEENTTYIEVPNPKFSIITNATLKLTGHAVSYWSEGDWGSPDFNVSNETSGNRRNTSVAAENDNIFVVWDDDRNGDNDIYFNEYNGNVWNNDTEISNDTDYPGSFQRLPSITAEDGKIYVVWQDDRPGHEDIYFNKYNGTAWQDTDNRVCRDAGTDTQEAPKIATDNGTVYAVWQDYRNGNYDIYFNKYESGVWGGTDLEISNGPGTSDQLYPSIAAENGKIYVVWHDDRNGDYDVYFNQYNGSAWGTSDIKISNGTNNKSQVYPAIAVENGNIYVSWKDNRSNKFEVYFNKYDGTSWGNTDIEISNIPSSKGTKDNTSAPIDIENGKLHVAWEDNRTGEWDIYYNNFNGVVWGTEDVKLSDLPIYLWDGQTCSIVFQEPSNDNNIKPSLTIENGNISVPWQRDPFVISDTLKEIY